MSSEPGGLLAPRELSSEEQEAKQNLIEAGNEAFDGDDFDKALECYHRASMLDSSDAKVWSLLGLAYTNLEFPEEAWRSYKLALTCDGDNLDALWYAGEFLVGMEDFEMANNILNRYLKLEQDPERRKEALEALDDIAEHLPERPPVVAQRDPDVDALEVDDLEDEDFDGYEMQDNEGYPLEAETNGDDEDGFDEEIDYELIESQEQSFVASLTLQLNGMEGKCQQCSSLLPADAPYCYSCRAPQFYQAG